MLSYVSFLYTNLANNVLIIIILHCSELKETNYIIFVRIHYKGTSRG